MVEVENSIWLLDSCKAQNGEAGSMADDKAEGVNVDAYLCRP